MQARTILLALGMLALIAVTLAVLAWPKSGPATATGTNSITSPDTGGNVGEYTSLAPPGVATCPGTPAP